MLTAIVIDYDDSNIEKYLKLFESSLIIKLNKTFVQETKAINYLNNYPVDIVFVDIEMCINSRHKLFSHIQSQIIFTSHSKDNACKAFDMNASDFLLKPFTSERFDTAIKKAIGNIERSKNSSNDKSKDFLLVRSQGRLNKVLISEIIYFTCLKDYTAIYLENNKRIIFKSTIKAIYDKLDKNYFIRISRSAIVPKNR